MADHNIKAGDKVTCINAEGKHGLTEGREYEVLSVSSGLGNLGIRNDFGNRVNVLRRRFKLAEPKKSVKQIEYEHQLALHYSTGGFYPMPKKPTKAPRSIKIDPLDAKAALTKMLKEVYGIEATVEQVIGAMDKSLELVLSE